MAELAVSGPLDEAYRDAYFRAHPVGAQSWKPCAFRERRTFDLECVQPRAQMKKHRGVEAGADLAGEDEVGPIVEADEKRAETLTRSLRVGEAADHEVARLL